MLFTYGNAAGLLSILITTSPHELRKVESGLTMKFDAIVIGSGQGGNPLAHRLADRKQTVALIEQKHLGGTCINTGCTPTKTMVVYLMDDSIYSRLASVSSSRHPAPIGLPASPYDKSTSNH